MKNFGALFFVAVGLVSSPCYAMYGTAPSDWLTGTWTLCDDPDQSPKESLQFNQDGSGLLVRAKGNIEFIHKHTDEKVYLLANANGKAIPIELAAAPEHDKLLLHSDRTGATSIYIRSDSTLIDDCSVK